MIEGNPTCGVDVHCGDTFLERLTFIFEPAWYSYNRKIFDNTAKTYATDYVLGVFMVYGACSVAVSCPPSRLRRLTIALLLLYALSVFSGGAAHQFFVTLEDVNSFQFQLLWSVCVGAVTTAGYFIGAIGKELAVAGPHVKLPTVPQAMACTTPFCIALGMLTGGLIGIASPSCGRVCVYASFVAGAIIGLVIGAGTAAVAPRTCVQAVLAFPSSIWAIFVAILGVMTVSGALSMARPAADIFVAGFAQGFPTLALAGCWTLHVKDSHTFNLSTLDRVLLIFAMLLAAPLIIIYPVFLSYLPQLSLGFVNAFLHCWLTVAWGLQWWMLQRYCQAYRGFSSVKGE